MKELRSLPSLSGLRAGERLRTDPVFSGWFFKAFFQTRWGLQEVFYISIFFLLGWR
jgi:hypothetical protein